VAVVNKCGAALGDEHRAVVAYRKRRVFQAGVEVPFGQRSIRSIPLTTRKGFALVGDNQGQSFRLTAWSRAMALPGSSFPLAFQT